MNNIDTTQKISDLQEQIRDLENQEKKLRGSVVTFDGKKELGGALFLIGSSLLFVSVVFQPACISLASIGVLIAGIIVFIVGYRNEKKMQADIAEIMKQIRGLHDEVTSWKKQRVE